MSSARQMLKLAALGNFAIAFTHVAFIFTGERVLHFFGAPLSVVSLQREKLVWFVVLLLAVAGMFCLFALYALSAAGLFRRLPLLRTALITIGVIYVLRGMEVVLDVIVILRTPQYYRFFLFSLVALIIGILYLGGAIGVWPALNPRPLPKTKAANARDNPWPATQTNGRSGRTRT